jgi:hypothetical protein
LNEKIIEVKQLENPQTILEEIEKYTKGEFKYKRNQKFPHKSYGYGHLNNQSIYIKENGKKGYSIEFKKENIMIAREELVKELRILKKKFKIKNIFEKENENDKDYDNILKLAASTINPYYILTHSQKKKKIEELFLKNENFMTVEEVDLFLLEFRRVSKVISFEGYGRLDINYYATINEHYFIIDKEKDEVVIHNNQLELEEYILTNLNIMPKQLGRGLL